jgi:Flp pilus assembly protein TadD
VARAEFAESQRLAPRDVGARLQLVQLNLLEGNTGAAVSLMNETVALQPRNAQVRLTLVDVLAAKGDLDAAVRDSGRGRSPDTTSTSRPDGVSSSPYRRAPTGRRASSPTA